MGLRPTAKDPRNYYSCCCSCWISRLTISHCLWLTSYLSMSQLILIFLSLSMNLSPFLWIYLAHLCLYQSISWSFFLSLNESIPISINLWGSFMPQSIRHRSGSRYRSCYNMHLTCQEEGLVAELGHDHHGERLDDAVDKAEAHLSGSGVECDVWRDV